MRVLICGSRHFNDYEVARGVLDSLFISHIIEGGARGADSLGAKYAETQGIPSSRFVAEWETYSRRAGPIRNARMLREGTPDMVVAFLAENSRGTKHMIKIAEEANIPVKTILVNSKGD